MVPLLQQLMGVRLRQEMVTILSARVAGRAMSAMWQHSRATKKLVPMRKSAHVATMTRISTTTIVRLHVLRPTLDPEDRPCRLTEVASVPCTTRARKLLLLQHLIGTHRVAGEHMDRRCRSSHTSRTTRIVGLTCVRIRLSTTTNLIPITSSPRLRNHTQLPQWHPTTITTMGSQTTTKSDCF